MTMSPTNSTRGQLRPHFAGRSPPFVLVGLCLGLFMLGFGYWSLNSEFKELTLQYDEMKNQYQINSQKRETAEKQNDLLQSKLQTQNEEIGKMKTSLDKKEQELSQLSQQLRNKDEEAAKATADLQKVKEEMDSMIKITKEKDVEINNLKEELKKSAVENEQLRSLEKKQEEDITKLKKEIELLKVTVKAAQNYTVGSTQSRPSNQVQEKLNENEAESMRQKDAHSPHNFIDGG